MNMLSILVDQVLKEPTPVVYAPAESTKVEWTAEMLDELGKMTDSAFAEKYNILRHQAYSKRTELGIKPVARTNSGMSKYVWPEDEQALFKKFNNSELAELLNIPYASIQHRRKWLGIEIDMTLVLVDAELTEAERGMRERMREKESHNAEKTAAIHQLRAQGKTYHQISNALGVSLGFISTALLKKITVIEPEEADETAAGQSVLDMAIEKLEIIDKLKLILKGQGINKVGDLVQLTKQDLLRMPNIGRYAFADIVMALEKHGLAIKAVKMTHAGTS